MELKVNNKIPQPTKVMFGSLMKGEIFMDEEGDFCMVLDEFYLCDNDLVNCIILSGPAMGEVRKMDSKEIVVTVKAEMNILGYE